MPLLSELRRTWLLIVTVAAAAAGVVAGFSFTTAKHYRATAVLVVAPVPAADPTFVGVDVLHDSGRSTAAATAARLVRTGEVADAVRVKLGLHDSSSALLDKVSAHEVGHSDAVAVTATDTDPARAAQIANGFVDAFVTARSAAFQSEVASAIGRVQQRLAELTAAQRTSPLGVRLQQRLADLRAQLGTSDPTVRHGSTAIQPTSAAWPDPVPWTIYAGLAGLALGALLALLVAFARAARRRAGGAALSPGGGDARSLERALERVAQRLERRLDAAAEALAARAESLQAPQPAAADPGAERERELAARAAELDERERRLREERERASAEAAEPAARADAEVERRAKELEERSQQLARREQALAQRTAELRSLEARVTAERGAREQEQAGAARAAREREAALERRERRLAERAEALDRRERALAQRADELDALDARAEAQRAELAERADHLAAREQELSVPAAPSPPAVPAPSAAPAPAPVPTPPPAAEHAEVPAPAAGWSLVELERLVDERSEAYPHRAEEWRSYLFYLRDYVDPDGRIPHQFDWLVEDTFGELLAAR